LKKGVIRWLGLVVLLAICTQMAVCMTSDHCDEIANSGAPAGSDCGCHDCACCSLHVGFPPEIRDFTAVLIERINPAPAPRITEKRSPRIEHPPRS
jgi:hypothetical protein